MWKHCLAITSRYAIIFEVLNVVVPKNVSADLKRKSSQRWKAELEIIFSSNSLTSQSSALLYQAKPSRYSIPKQTPPLYKYIFNLHLSPSFSSSLWDVQCWGRGQKGSFFPNWVCFYPTLVNKCQGWGPKPQQQRPFTTWPPVFEVWSLFESFWKHRSLFLHTAYASVLIGVFALTKWRALLLGWILLCS